MHLLVIGYVWPEPNSSAAGSRMMQLLNSFHKEQWQISFASPAQQTEHMADLSQLGIEAEHIELNSDSFDHYIAEKKPDIVVFDRFMMEEQFGWRVEKFSPDSLRVLNTEDLHSLRQARHNALKQNREFVIEDLYNDHGIREIAAIHRCDLTLMISEVEAKLLVDQFHVPETHVFHLPFMLPEPQQTDTLRSFEDREHFISIGNFRHAPNWDAVLQLKTEIWPKIRKRLPKAEMHIYGAYPPPKATQLHNAKEGFLVKGWAEDAQTVMQQARLCLAPLRFGAGIKGKLVEAMQVGTPSITTSIGAESMHGVLPWNGVITDNIDTFVDAAVSLYEDKESWLLMQQNGNTILQARYQAEEWEPKLINRLKLQLQLKESLRNKHFLGLMLRHHSLKSTQYMSQWIELKNKNEEK
ncbi:glycosyltransferase involved in cell wall biosynthesis [Marinomonas alcarazii]|uniref:Glycosyltransferase involved in cell wall biosynthesis n=1 Tax=Marinomonas alcarazii TaxID=491949 RepID=A0A318V6L6_9GAMM|nr:glycosyltransferase family 4 protein [Marinomonas alcarazii]PYF84254.1 glycosyltransferase involved in cell wall biosynthesis [Marinomonas alcarazii]